MKFYATKLLLVISFVVNILLVYNRTKNRDINLELDLNKYNLLQGKDKMGTIESTTTVEQFRFKSLENETKVIIKEAHKKIGDKLKAQTKNLVNIKTIEKAQTKNQEKTTTKSKAKTNEKASSHVNSKFNTEIKAQIKTEIQTKTEARTKTEHSETEESNKERYHVTLNTFTLDENKPEEMSPNFKGAIEFQKMNLKIHIKHSEKTIPYTEFLFWDGIVIYRSHEFKFIKTPIFKAIFEKLKPGLETIIQSKGSREFQNSCYTFVKMKHKIPGDYKTIIRTQLVVACFKSSETENIKEKFYKKFINYHSVAVKEEKQLLKLQRYQLGLQIQLQYWDNDITFDNTNPVAKKYYSVITPQGFTLSDVKNKDPVNIQLSFRFDQIINARSISTQKVKAVMKEGISSVYKDNDACAGYLVEWNGKPDYNLICSMYLHGAKARTDIKIIVATVYKLTMVEGMESLINEIRRCSKDLTTTKINFLRRSKYIHILDEVIKQDFTPFVKPKSKFKEYYDFLKPGSVQWMLELMKGLQNMQEQYADFRGTTYNPEELMIKKSELEAFYSKRSQFTIDDWESEMKRKEEELHSVYSMTIIEELMTKYEKLWSKHSVGYKEESRFAVRKIEGGTVEVHMTEEKEFITEQIMKGLRYEMHGKELTIQQRIRLLKFIRQHFHMFQLMIENGVTLTFEMVERMEYSEEITIVEMIKKRIVEAKWRFKYEKKWDKSEAHSEEWSKSWSSGGYNESSSRDIHWIPPTPPPVGSSWNYSWSSTHEPKYPVPPPANYNDNDDFNLLFAKCGRNGKPSGIKSKPETDTPEPPIIPEVDGQRNTTNITIVVPPMDPVQPQYRPSLPPIPEDSTCKFNITVERDWNISFSWPPSTQYPPPDHPCGPGYPNFPCDKCKPGDPWWPLCKKCPNPETRFCCLHPYEQCCLNGEECPPCEGKCCHNDNYCYKNPDAPCCGPKSPIDCPECDPWDFCCWDKEDPCCKNHNQENCPKCSPTHKYYKTGCKPPKTRKDPLPPFIPIISLPPKSSPPLKERLFCPSGDQSCCNPAKDECCDPIKAADNPRCCDETKRSLL